MGGKVLELKSETLKREARLEEIFSSVQEGDYSLERGAQKAIMEAGYKIPAGV